MPEPKKEKVPPPPPADIGGENAHLPDLFALVYDELRGLAAAKMARSGSTPSLQPTALVHEAYMRLLKKKPFCIQDRRQFFGYAARAMRDIVVEHVRRRKGKVGIENVEMLESEALGEGGGFEDILRLDAALKKLELKYPRKCEVVQLRFFGGRMMAEIADELGVSIKSIERDWAFARAWLQREMARGEA